MPPLIILLVLVCRPATAPDGGACSDRGAGRLLAGPMVLGRRRKATKQLSLNYIGRLGWTVPTYRPNSLPWRYSSRSATCLIIWWPHY